MLSKNRLEVASAVSVSFAGTKWAILVNLSKTTRIASKPAAVSGRWVMKSIEMDCHCFLGISSGCRNVLDA